MGRGRPHGSRRRPGRSGTRGGSAFFVGIIKISRPGIAVVETGEGIFPVARGGVREAMNGDEVRVSLSAPRHGSERLAFVQSVVQRAQQSFLGSYGMADPLGVVVPLDGRMTHDFFVLPEDRSATRLGVQEGDVVMARILEYPSRHGAGVVTIERRVGAHDGIDLNIETIVASYDLAGEFSLVALKEAEALAVDAQEALRGSSHREDLRGHLCLTIDPADARDFDDAVGARRLTDGYEVAVHIADVTHYVAWGSSIDLEARRRTCSAYLVDRVIPMLPERLCNDVCSLRPKEDRLAMSVIMRLDSDGNVTGVRVTRSVMRSRARLDYGEVDAFLEGELTSEGLTCSSEDAPAVGQAITLLDEIASLRGQQRHKRGAIDFESREAKVRLDEDGRPLGVEVRRRTRATGLVEEAMLLANESVAHMLSESGVQTAYRVHEQPTPEDLQAVAALLRELGLIEGDRADSLVAGNPRAIQEVLASMRGRPEELLVSSLLLRAQKRAIYLPHNGGHYALGADAYCHFTSPIRRYPDILVHRALKSLLDGRIHSKVALDMERRLPQLCRSCSDRERAADAASRESHKAKMAELFAGHLGESFSGIVVGCERYGLFVMLDESCAEGLLPTRSLGNERFDFDAAHLTLTGEETGKVWQLGRRIAVTVTGANPARGQIDFALAEGSAKA